MRPLTDSEMAKCAAGWRRYKSEYETEPTHIWPFEHGFTAGLEHAAEQLAALTAERDGLRAALKPFADAAEVWQSEDSQRVIARCRVGVKGLPDLLITVGDLLAARKAREGSADEQKQEIRH